MSLRLDRSLQGSLAARAAGRIVVIDAYRTWNCGTWVGDLTAKLADAAPGDGFTELAPVDGVPAYANAGVVRLLDTAGASLHAVGRFRGSGLRVELDRPELWIDYLEHPGAWAPHAEDPHPAS